MPTIKPIKEKETNTQIYPQTSTEAVVGLSAYVDGKINTAVGQIHTSESTSIPLTNFDFADIDQLTEGTYIVTNATNSPFNGETSGVLKIIATGSNKYVHTWNGKKYTGFREYGQFNPLEAGVDSITVNGHLISTAISDEYNEYGVKFTYEQKDTTNFNSGKIMWLYPGATYTLSGVLIDCQIRVGYLSTWCKKGTTEFQAKTFDSASDNLETTTIILDNFYSKMSREVVYDSSDEDSWTAAIEQYGPLIRSDISGKTNRRGKIVIELAANSKNYLVRECTPTMETANNKWGVIYSEQDLDISGTGYLGIADGADNEHLMGCHAIKAKGNLIVHDTPHIVGRAYHDLLHGNDGLYVEGGYFQMLYGNDTLGTDTSLGDQAIGKVRLYNAIFDIRECYGTFCQADNVIVYPGVKIYFNTIGEGLWLQCKEGFYKGEITKKGQVSNFGMVDYTNHEFRLYTPTLKLDAAAFTELLEETSSSSVKILFDGSEQDIAVTRTTYEFPGIIVYNGVSIVPDAEYSYTESDRNTHVSELTNSDSNVTTYNGSYTPIDTTTVITDEPTVAEAASFVTDVLDAEDADFDSIDFTYSGTASGGIWNVGITEQKLTEYKNEVDYLLTCIKGMVVPPKEVGVLGTETASYDIVEGVYTTENVENLRNDTFINTGSEIAAGAQINGQTVVAKIKTDSPIYTSKTMIEPTINLTVGEAILVKGFLSPEDTTNYAMKWSVVGESEWTVIGRLVTDDTLGCYVRGLQPGEESIIISAKALSKDNVKVSLKVHFVVTAPAEPTEEPEPQTEP